MTCPVLFIALLAATPVEHSAEGVAVIRGAFVPGEQPDGNTVVLHGEGRAIVVDTGRHEAHRLAIERFLDAEGLRLEVIVNTHWHLDHVSGNAALRARASQPRVYAAPTLQAARRGFLARYRAQLVASLREADPPARARHEAEIARIDGAASLAPDVPLRASQRRVLAGRRVDLRVTVPAATRADVWLYDHASATLVAGDLVTLPAPFLDTACPEGWRRELRTLARVPFQRVVPGHGPVLDRAGFDRYRDAFERFVDCSASPARPAECASAWRHALRAELAGTERTFVDGLLGYYVDLLRRDTAGITARCAESDSAADA